MGLIYKKNSNVYVFDSNADSGVTLQEWTYFIEENDLFEKIVFRKITNESGIQKSLETFIDQTQGCNYEVSLYKIFSDTSVPEGHSYFCSELVAEAYKKLAVFDTNKPSTMFWPSKSLLYRRLQWP